MIHEVNGWEEDDNVWDEGDDDPDPMVLVCGYPGCCMPGYHFRSECHNAEDIEAMNAEFAADNPSCACTFGQGSNFHSEGCPLRGSAHPQKESGT